MAKLASVVISQLICTTALIVLIIILPVYYSNIQDNIRVNVMKIELKEIADYVSSTLSNTYFLVNSTNCPNVTLTKTLVYLPKTVENSFFVVQIDKDGAAAASVTVYIKDRPGVYSTAWLSPGLKCGNVNPVESGKGAVAAGCYRPSNNTGVYVQLGYEVT